MSRTGPHPRMATETQLSLHFIHAKASSVNHPCPPTPNLGSRPSGDVPNTNSLRRSSRTSLLPTDFNIAWSFGPSCMPLAPIPRRDSSKPRCFDPWMGGSMFAMPFADWPAISKNRIEHSPSKPLMRPFSGGKANQLHKHQHYEPLGPSVQISIGIYGNFSDNGI